MHANDAKTFLKHFSDCLFYFCFTCADSITRVHHCVLSTPVYLYDMWLQSSHISDALLLFCILVKITIFSLISGYLHLFPKNFQRVFHDLQQSFSMTTQRLAQCTIFYFYIIPSIRNIPAPPIRRFYALTLCTLQMFLRLWLHRILSTSSNTSNLLQYINKNGLPSNQWNKLKTPKMIIFLLKNSTTYWWNSMTTVIFHYFPGPENSLLKFHDSPGCVGIL